MKQKTSVLLCLVLSLGIASCAAPAHPHDVQREVSLYNFETTAELNSWETSPLASIKASKNWTSKGSQSARITFRAWDPHKKTPPPSSAADAGDAEMLEPAPTSASATGSVKASIPALQQSGNKLSSYDFLEFEAHNPGTTTVYFNFALTGTLRSRNLPIELRAGQTQTVRIALREPPLLEGSPLTDQIGRYLSSENADSISFNLPYSPRDVAIDIDNLRLIIGPTAGLNPLSKLPYAPHQKIDALKKVIDSSLQNATWTQITSWRENIHALKQESETLRQQWNEEQARKAAEPAGFALAIESTFRKVFLEKSRFESTFDGAKTHNLYAARNEAESFQAIIFPIGKDLNNVGWELTPLKNKTGKTIPASVRLVGYVETKQEPRYHVPFLGWWPDPLIDQVNQLDKIPQDEVRSLWVTVEVPKDAEAGHYTGMLNVTANGETQHVNVDLEVWGFSLPVRSSLPMLAQLTRLNSMSQFAPPQEPKSTFAERYAQTTRDYENWLLKYRIQPGNIYAGGPPSWDADRIKELVGNGLSAINLAYIRIQRRESETYNEADYWKHFDSRVANIEAGIPTLKKAGVWDNPDVMLYINLFDEWPGKHIGIVYETAKKLKQLFPNVKLVTTAQDYSYGLGRPESKFIDIWIPSAHLLDANRMHMEQARTEGKDFWWYFAVGSYKPYPNLWLESPAEDARIMGSISYKYNVPGFMYWSVNRWFNNNPRNISKNPRTKWNAQSFGSGVKNAAHGEGSLFYATGAKNGLGSRPLASIRLENYRDGEEDYEYYVLLEKLRRAKGISPARVEISESVIRNVSNYTDDAADFQQQRKMMAEKILKLQRS